MKRFKLYFIDSDYINYLRKFDSRVAYNKIPNRPYIGIVYKYNGYNYFAPLSSPKSKYITISYKVIDIFKIEDGKLGVINLNNMIPCPIEVLTEAIPIIKDRKYKILLENQLTYINANKEALYKKTEIFQEKYRQGYLYPSITNRCCNFPILEQKIKDYIKKVSLST